MVRRNKQKDIRKKLLNKENEKYINKYKYINKRMGKLFGIKQFMQKQSGKREEQNNVGGTDEESKSKRRRK